MEKISDADRANEELRAIVAKYPPDYVAPSLSNLLVETAIGIGLSRDSVLEGIANLWALHMALKGSE